jgi:drug/metabolite transporter (DMT)-like permease
MNKHKVIAVCIIVCLSGIGVFGDLLLKLSGHSDKPVDLRLLSAGILIYAVTGIGWFYALKQINLASVGALYAVTTVLFLTILSMSYFKEGFNIREIIGILMGIISLCLLARFG